MKKYQMLIGGAWTDPASGEWLESVNPFTAAPWALIPARLQSLTLIALWKPRGKPSMAIGASSPPLRAGRLLHKLGELIAADADRLAQIESTDNGKLIAEMRGQLNYIPQWFYYFGGLADKIEGRVIPIDKPGVFNYTREEPLGVIAAITPWNSPLLLAAWKLAPALAAGNTVVWKPSEYSSVSALELGSLFEKAGIPARSSQHRHRPRGRNRRTSDHTSGGRQSSVHRRRQDRSARLRTGSPRHQARHAWSWAGSPPISFSTMPTSTEP